MGVVLRGNLAASSGIFLWATAIPATEILLADWQPLVLAAARIGLAGFVLLTLAALTGHLRELRQVRLRDALLVGGTGFAMAPALLVVGQSVSHQVTTAIISTLVPLVSAVIARALGEEPLDRRRVFALALGIGGGILAVTAGVGGDMGFKGGEILILMAMVFWVLGSRMAVTRLGHLSDVARSAVCVGTAGACLCVVAALAVLLGLVTPRAELDARSLSLLAWIAVMAVGASTVSWLAAARLIGVTMAAMHQNLVPFYVMAIAVALGGHVAPLQIVGALLVVAGTVLAQLPAGRLTRLRFRLMH